MNTQPSDERLIAKNAERVVTARLRDARFFWEADQKVPLEARLDRLHTLLFHKKLGSYRDKAERISALAGWIAGEALGASAESTHAATAARLAKADLTTDMVFEFTELQGTIGGIYARQQGLPEQIWKAIYYQYLPIGVEADGPPSRDQLGAAAVSWAAVSLADKLDTFVSLSRAGERATGSRDPFGLRRQTQGAVRILMDLPQLTGIDREVWLGPLLARAAAHAPDSTGPWTAEAAQAALAFAVERVRFALEQRGFPAEVVRAATPDGDISPLRARRVAEAIQGIRASEDFQALAVLFKRVKNIAPRSGQGPPAGSGHASPWREPASSIGARSPRRPSSRSSRSSTTVALASKPQRHGAITAPRSSKSPASRAAVDRFFTEVFVMADDVRVRHARLTLMADLRDLILHLADISEIIPQTE